MWELNHLHSHSITMISIIIAMISSQTLIQLCTSSKHKKTMGHVSFTGFIGCFTILPMHVLPWATSAILGALLLHCIRSTNARPTQLNRIQQGVALIVTVLVTALYIGMEIIGFDWAMNNLNGLSQISSSNDELNVAIELTLTESSQKLRNHYQAIHSLWLAVLTFSWVCITVILTSIHSKPTEKMSES
ncbi:hypothetical protein AB6D11_06020 [Vibrio splendidus]